MKRSTKKFNIGDIFLTWEVKSEVQGKRYRYHCECVQCGNRREFIKYNLLRGSYAPCRQCKSIKAINTQLISKHWNCELNEEVFDIDKEYNLTRSYWFICNNGHNFKSSIKDFKLSRCRGCIEHPPNHPSKVQAFEYAKQYFKTVTSVDDCGQFLLRLHDFDTTLFFHEENRYTNYRNYFSSENEMLEEFTNVKTNENKSKSSGSKFIYVPTQINFKINVDKITQIMLQLVSESLD